jgi:hypothetical protein
MLRSVSLALAICCAPLACTADDAASGGGGEGSADACTDIVGSCRIAEACTDYAGIEPELVEPSCTSTGTWSDEPCPSAGTIGGCQAENLSRGCAVTWYYAPATEADLDQFCDRAGGTLIPGAQ